jgi:kumamolisin
LASNETEANLALERVVIRGSERSPLPNSEPVGVPDPTERVEVTVVLRRKAEPPSHVEEPIGRAEFARLYGARPEDIPPLEKFAA